MGISRDHKKFFYAKAVLMSFVWIFSYKNGNAQLPRSSSKWPFKLDWSSGTFPSFTTSRANAEIAATLGSSTCTSVMAATKFEYSGTRYSQGQVDFSDPKAKEFNFRQECQKDKNIYKKNGEFIMWSDC